jgi:hypothetical protein
MLRNARLQRLRLIGNDAGRGTAGSSTPLAFPSGTQVPVGMTDKERRMTDKKLEITDKKSPGTEPGLLYDHLFGS